MKTEKTFSELATAIDQATGIVEHNKRDVEQSDAEIVALLAKQEEELNHLTNIRFNRNAVLTKTIEQVNALHNEMHARLTGVKVTDTPKPDPTAKELKDLYLTVQKNRK